MNPNDRPRFSAILSRVAIELAKLPADKQADYRDRFEAEVAAADGKRPIDPVKFLGDGATGQEVAKAFADEQEARGVQGHGRQWATEHGAQAFRNFIPAFA